MVVDFRPPIDNAYLHVWHHVGFCGYPAIKCSPAIFAITFNLKPRFLDFQIVFPNQSTLKIQATRIFFCVTSFLVDTEAQLSILPKYYANIGAENFIKLAANGTSIPKFGKRELKLDFGLGRPFSWTFCVADIPHLIVGADLIVNKKLLVDMDG